MTQYIPEGLPDRIRHYIDGEFVDSIGGETFDVLDPVSNETYVQAAAGQKADIDRAVAAAKRAFQEGPWPRMLPRERSRVLHRIADAVEAQDARLAELETFDTGLPITEAYWVKILLEGQPEDALLQCFERRCLTWTPSNPAGWQVEAGNVGLHYYLWRYGELPPRPVG